MADFVDKVGSYTENRISLGQASKKARSETLISKKFL